MGIKPKCAYCGKELNEFGGILFSPPTSDGVVEKYHVCVTCYDNIKPTPKWIYRYIRADMEEIDMGFYPTRDVAEQARSEHTQFGAMCGNVEKVPPNYKLYKGGE